VTNLARFTIDGDPSSNAGYDCSASDTPDLQLETSSSLVRKVTFWVYDSGDADSPLASKDAPTLTLDNGSTTGQKVDALTPTGTVEITSGIPATAAVAHSWLVRCVVNDGLDADGQPDADLVFERLMCLRNAQSLRKMVPAEGTEYDARGWADFVNECIDYNYGSGIPTFTSTDNHLPRADGTGGTLQDGAQVEDDSGNVSGATSYACDIFKAATGTPAASGLLRAPKSVTVAAVRNAADSADLPLVAVGASDDATIGDSGLSLVINGSSVTLKHGGSTKVATTATGAAVTGNLTVSGTCTVNSVDVNAHAGRHVQGGADELDGDKVDIDWSPTIWTPDASPAEVDDTAQLVALLAGCQRYNAMSRLLALFDLVWDADYGITVSGSDVAYWLPMKTASASRSGTLGSLGNAPAYAATGMNSLPAVLFDDSNTEYLEHDTTAGDYTHGGSGAACICIAAHFQKDATADGAIAYFGDGTNDSYGGLAVGTNYSCQLEGDGGTGKTRSVAGGDTEEHTAVFLYACNAGTICDFYLWVDGVAQSLGADASDPGATTFSRFEIGRRPVGSPDKYLSGYIRRVAIGRVQADLALAKAIHLAWYGR